MAPKSPFEQSGGQGCLESVKAKYSQVTRGSGDKTLGTRMLSQEPDTFCDAEKGNYLPARFSK